MRALLALCLSLLIAVSARAEAVARFEMAGSSVFTLCDAAGHAEVMLDASGHKVTHRACTHCLAAHVFADLPGPVAPLVFTATRTIRLALPAAQAVARAISRPAHARAPPLMLS